jgi:thiol-disulfide isomerase/thioredoxin
MDILWSASLIILWIVVLLNLLLTLRTVRLLRGQESLRKLAAEAEELPELAVGTVAPPFSVRTLLGEPVDHLTYAGRSVAFIFVSPLCGHCRDEMPALTRLAPLALERAGVTLVLVSDAKASATHTWLTTIRAEDGVDVTLPVLVAPRNSNDFIVRYNPRGLSPYHCLVDGEGKVQSRGPLSMNDWNVLQQSWSGAVPRRPGLRVASRYR